LRSRLCPLQSTIPPAVVCIDEIQRLLRAVGSRFIENGFVNSPEGRLLLFWPVPAWEDYVNLGVNEIRLYGAESLQVVRRLRAMLKELIRDLPPSRTPALLEQLQAIDQLSKESFHASLDKGASTVPDDQGLGSPKVFTDTVYDSEPSE